jgi:photosystem II stability/assembly factor-like uncharacterized protein
LYDLDFATIAANLNMRLSFARVVLTLITMMALALASAGVFARQAPATAPTALNAQSAGAWRPVASGVTTELRGLSVVSDTVAWASGARGTVLRTIDGAHWQAIQVTDADKLDFRDIHAIDAKSALVMSAGPGALSRIYRTDDAGASWRLLAANQFAEGFWDAMAFWDADNGIVFGDPVKGRFQAYVTTDGGATWRQLDGKGLDALENEGAFAASGTCLSVAGTRDAWIVTGGAHASRVFHSSDRGVTWQAASLPIPAGAPARGAFSVGFLNARVGMAAGGDYQEAALAAVNGARTEDGGATWAAAAILPAGYLSVVMPVPGAAASFVAAGLAGSGYSLDAGKSWTVLDRTPINTVGFATPAAGWAIGPKGLLLKYTGPALRAQPE